MSQAYQGTTYVEMQDPKAAAAAQHMAMVKDRPKWSWSATILSAVTMFLCCPICSFIGVLYAIHGYTDHKSGDYERSKTKVSCSKKWSYASIGSGILVMIIIIAMYVLVWKAVSQQVYSFKP